ncbi:hypothetical protein OFN50_35435, partial [Escherichia coli]|nr:hypothetical protein [Escherichia coli]
PIDAFLNSCEVETFEFNHETPPIWLLLVKLTPSTRLCKVSGLHNQTTISFHILKTILLHIK